MVSKPLLRQLACLALLTGCASGPEPPYVPDRLPGVDAVELAPVVVLSGEGPGIGSAVCVEPRRLVTARHVVDALREGPGDELELSIDHARVRARVLAQGELADPHGDYALLEVLDERWRAPRVAPLHEPALDPDWRPAVGAELVVAGYATRFFEDLAVDVDVPAPVLRLVALAQEDEDPSWYAASRGHELAGMSGGGVFVWSAARERLELVGLLVGQRRIDSTLEGPLGLRIPLGGSSAVRLGRLPELGGGGGQGGQEADTEGTELRGGHGGAREGEAAASEPSLRVRRRAPLRQAVTGTRVDGSDTFIARSSASTSSGEGRPQAGS